MPGEHVLPLHPAPEGEDRALESLARAHGVETAHRGLDGREVHASPAALRGALQALGVAADTPAGIEDAVWQRQQQLHLRLVEPVVVTWEGTPPVVPLSPARAEAGQSIECRLQTEQGDEREWSTEDPRLALPEDLPTGYHRLEVRVGDREASAWVLRAPAAAPDPRRRGWATFLPLYALRARGSWGTGDFGDLAALLEWTRSLGGDLVGTLPLQAAFLDEPFDPSPYAPVSRLFWNELYVDVEAAPELASSAAARAELESDELRRTARELHRAPRVDYRAAMVLKRRVLEPLAREFFAGDAWRSDGFQAFLGENPEIRTYARFRGACELWKRGWREWPPEMRGGRLKAGDFPEESARYHLYVQWLAAKQLGRLSEDKQAGRGLYLDLPVGVHPDGYDAWRFRELYADGATVGAPPDNFFAGGQDWGVRPLHPERIREEGYRYVAAALRTLCRHAGSLRIDHVMGLHRLWWVPRGAGAKDGVYVRYRAEELWAVACLEAHRSGTEIVGEDLGTVPPEVRDEMERRAARRMYVVPFQLREDPPDLPEPPRAAVASLGTHDLPPFARWWADAPSGRRRALAAALERAGALEPVDPSALPESQRVRPVLEAALRWLSDSPARLVMVNLEDLWLETEPQNEPGTTMAERPNWRRKARFAIETFREMPEVIEPLRNVARRRPEGTGT